MTAIPHIEDLADSSFDPYLADEVVFGDHADPYSRIEELREAGPVVPGDYRSAMGLPAEPVDPSKQRFTVLSYAAVEQIMNQPEVFSNRSFEPTLGEVFGPILSVMDPPEHTKYRRILQKAFRPQVVQTWGHSIVAPVVAELIGAFRGAGRAELVEQFARPYPFQVLYRMLGLPPEDVDVFYRLTIAQLVTSVSMANAQEAATKLGRYFAAMLEERAARPRDDVVSVLATVQVDGTSLPEDVSIGFLRQLMSAGGETTFRSTAILFTGMLTNPTQLDAVRSDRSLVPAAVEEALRWDGPVVSSTRETTRDVVLDGIPIPAGSHLDVLYGAANRDPAVFERPSAFDIFRAKHRHFGFAFGAHNCLGQHLARLEMTRALSALLDRLPNVRLDPAAEPPAIRGAMMRIPRALHVAFD